MARNSVFRELREEHILEDEDYWLHEDTDEDEEAENELFGDVRRPYTLRGHADLNEWDDVGFYQRFRMKKHTFLRVVDMVEPHLRVENRR